MCPPDTRGGPSFWPKNHLRDLGTHRSVIHGAVVVLWPERGTLAQRLATAGCSTADAGYPTPHKNGSALPRIRRKVVAGPALLLCAAASRVWDYLGR